MGNATALVSRFPLSSENETRTNKSLTVTDSDLAPVTTEQAGAFLHACGFPCELKPSSLWRVTHRNLSPFEESSPSG